MLVEEINNVIVEGGEHECIEVEASIEANAINFRAVTAYQHPVNALLRELGQNAADSHCRVGKADVPFDVTIPNEISPNLIVRDYGEGMDDQEFRDYVINVGASSKRGADGQTGGFGRGLYAILGYTDMFTMRCWKGGMEYNHVCFISETGLPKWKLGVGTPSTEQSGVEVSVPVESKDFWEFRSEAQKVYGVFGHQYSNYLCKPLINGKPPEEKRYSMEGEGYALSYDRSAVVMGNVSYPIILTDRARDALSDTALKLVNSGIIVYMPLAVSRNGKMVSPVTPAPQRDGLIYTENTIASISDALERVAACILDDAAGVVAACETQWQARLKFKEVFGGGYHTTLIGQLRSAAKYDVMYEGMDMSLGIRACEFQFIPCEINPPQTVEKQVRFVNITKYSRFGQRVKSLAHLDALPVDEDITVFIDDTKSHHVARARHWCTTNYDDCYVVSPIDGHDMDEWVNKYGLSEILLSLDQQPLPPSVRHKAKPGKVSKELLYNPSGKGSSAWEDTEVDLEEGGVYVEVCRYSWRNRGEEDYRGVCGLRDYRILLEDTRLIGLRAAPAKKIANSKELQAKWKTLEEFLLEKATEAFKAQDDLAALRSREDLSCAVRLRGVFSVTSTYGEALQAYLDADMSDERKEAAERLSRIYRSLRWWMKQHGMDEPDCNRFKSLIERVEATYPALDDLSWRSKSKAIHYIRAVDFMNDMPYNRS